MRSMNYLSWKMSSSVRAIQAENQSISQEIRISQYHKFEIINEHFEMSNASHALTCNQHFSRCHALPTMTKSFKLFELFKYNT